MINFQVFKCEEYQDTYMISFPSKTGQEFDEMRDWLSKLRKYGTETMIYFFNMEFLTVLNLKFG
jgi:hypothetical protein